MNLPPRSTGRLPDVPDPRRPRVKRSVPRPVWLIFSVFVLFAVLSNSLTGCSAGGGVPLTRVFGFGEGAREEAAKKTPDYQRFRQVYDKHASKDAGYGRQIDHFTDAYSRIRSDYVRGLQDKALIDAAISGIEKLEGTPGRQSSAAVTEAALDAMTASLDPHSGYLNPQEYKEVESVTRGEFGGLGIEINMAPSGNLEIIAPIEDTPAFRAGLKPGDQITHVGPTPIKGMTIMQAVRRLRGRPRTDVRLTILRPNVGSFKVTITRATIQVRPVKWRVEGRVGVIRVTQFNQNSQESLTSAYSKIRRQLGPQLRGIVLDLRNNPGGLLNQSVSVTDSFLSKGEIVSVRDRRGVVRGFKAHSGDITNGLPLVVLINGGSASASEIVSGALQDHKRATVMGGRSFGKGSVQTIAPLNWAGALRLTTQLYFLPSGRSIQGAGVQPDIAIASKDDRPWRRESDNPRSLQHTPPKGETGLKTAEQERLTVENCPALGAKNDDRLLGCAVMFVRTGNQARFMAMLEGRQPL